MEKRKCTICKETKDLTEFHRSKLRAKGREYFCKVCTVVRSREYREANREKVNEIARNSYARHKDRHSIRARSEYLYPNAFRCSVEGCQEQGERHHLNYQDAGLIVWLCRVHHRLLHSKS